MNRPKPGVGPAATGAVHQTSRPTTRPAFPAQIPGLRPQPVVRSAAGRPAAATQAPRGSGLDSEAVRLALVRRLVAQGLQHPAVERAMATVERHRFVDTGLASQAYEDISLPIGLGQTCLLYTSPSPRDS